MCWCHWILHIWFPIHIYSNRMSIPHRQLLQPTQLFSPISYHQAQIKKNRKSRSAPNDLNMTLNATRSKVLIYVALPTTSPKFFTPFCSTINNVFQIIEVFDFSAGYNGKFEIFKKKSLKIGNSKFQKSATYFCEDHWEEISVQFSKLLSTICRRSSVLKFLLPLGPMLTKTTKIC